MLFGRRAWRLGLVKDAAHVQVAVIFSYLNHGERPPFPVEMQVRLSCHIPQ